MQFRFSIACLVSERCVGSCVCACFVLFCFVLFVLQLSVVPQWASATTAGPFSMWGFRVTAEETRCRIATKALANGECRRALNPL